MQSTSTQLLRSSEPFRKCLLSPLAVGYGTQTPASVTGKAIGGFCAIVGVFILTLPVPIVVNSFASYYKNRLWRNEVAHKRRIRSNEQARLVKVRRDIFRDQYFDKPLCLATLKREQLLYREIPA